MHTFSIGSQFKEGVRVEPELNISIKKKKKIATLIWECVNSKWLFIIALPQLEDCAQLWAVCL